MKKFAQLGLKLIFVIVFNLIFFLVGGFDHSASVWLSFAVINLSYVLILLVPRMVTGGREASTFAPVLYSATTTYFFVQLVAGVALILIDFDNIKIPIIIHVLIAAVYAFILFSNISANETTAATVAKREEDLQYIRKTTLKIKDALADAQDEELKKKLGRLLDIVSTSPSKSNMDAREFEIAVNECIDGIQRNILGGNTELAMENADKAIRAAEMRNRRL